MENRHSIGLSSKRKSDLKIIVWKKKTIAAKKASATALIKKAIIHFIETGEFYDIGHIHLTEEDENLNVNECILLRTIRIPIIEKWIQANRDLGITAAASIKLLLNQCIKIVPEAEEEYFPRLDKKTYYNDSDLLTKMRKNAKKVREESVEVEPLETDSETISGLQPNKVNEKAEDIKETVNAVDKPKEEVRSLSSAEIGLNGILPQRGKKR